MCINLYSYLCRALNTVKVSKVKYVVWSSDMSHVALLGRNGEFTISVSYD